jgi:hypothetical protein
VLMLNASISHIEGLLEIYLYEIMYCHSPLTMPN